MGVVRRLALLSLVVLIAAALVWFRPPASSRYMRIPVIKPVPDLQAISPLNQPGGGPAPADAYPVYSSLYQASINEPLAFEEDSQTDIPQVGQSCLRPATPEEREMSDGFVEANRQSHRWEPKFSIAGYRLLTATQVSQALFCLAMHMPDRPQCTDFRQLRYVRLLGVPAFNRTHTRALVSVIKKCGEFCGTGGIFEVERADGSWQRSSPTEFTRNCSWMY